MSKTRNFDSKCYDLAEHFLNGDYDLDATDELAQHIQDAIEDWLVDRDDAAAEKAYQRQQEALMESGGPDDSQYRADLENAGRGHLVKP